MALQLGDLAPDFSARTTEGLIHFHHWAGEHWVVLFSHPRDFTPVCTTEMGRVAQLKYEFARREVRVIGLSLDTVDSHQRWAHDIRDTQGVALNFPVIADLDRSVASLYGLIHPNHDEAFTVRTVFIIDPHKRIRLTLTYPLSCGRNFDEILRTIDSLQLTDAHAVATPAGWREGDDVIIAPSLSDADAAHHFPRGWRALTPYLRVVPDPRAGIRSVARANIRMFGLAAATLLAATLGFRSWRKRESRAAPA
jgi:thioredoxin-dependent peroxiredoxin